MKRKIKLLLTNKIRLSVFIIVTILLMAPTIVIPKYKWDHANVLEKGVTCIRGNSMSPSIEDNTIMYVDNLSFKRGSVVAVRNHSTLKYNADTRKTLLKRIIGLPGETVEITEEGVLINGELLDEPYTDSANKTLQENNDIQEIVLSDNEYFVLGDNREESFDSRHIGAINKSDFLYELKLKKTDYVKEIEKKNSIILTVVIFVLIITPIICFFLCTIEPKKKESPGETQCGNKKKY